MTDQANTMTDRGRFRTLVFDSGLGGVSIAREIARLAPDLDLAYAADTGFFPYSRQPVPALLARLPKLISALTDAARADLVVIACNTASTLCLEAIRAHVQVPVVATVPAIKPAAALTRSGVIGLLATPVTVSRGYTTDLITDFAKDARVLKIGSARLVELAEARLMGEPVTESEIAEALEPLLSQPGVEAMDALVLACTHFPLLSDLIGAVVGPGVTLVDSGSAVARQALRILAASSATPAERIESHSIFVTSSDARAEQVTACLIRNGFAGPSKLLALPA
jgi:glutamate racemase